MADGAQQSGQPPSGGGPHDNGVWRYVVGTAMVPVLITLLSQLHGCGTDSPQTSPTSTVTETTAPSTPSVSAHITGIVYRGVNSANAAYGDVEIDIDTTGLRGQECLIKWSTYYPYKHGQGGTDTGYSGHGSTGLLPYENTAASPVLAVQAQHSGWMVHVFVYGPDGTLLDQRDGPTR
jgi:hypothetical protein